MKGHSHSNTTDNLPEIFIWYMVKALASACTVLQLDRVPQADEEYDPLPGWKPIMHLDMGAANVLLKLSIKDRGEERGRKRKGGTIDGPLRKKPRPEEDEDWTSSDWDVSRETSKMHLMPANPSQNLPVRPV
jgi:hypothetical protein